MKRILGIFIFLYLFIGCSSNINEDNKKKNDIDTLVYITVPSKDVNAYKTMINMFWHDIGISELKENEKLYFKINYIRASSILDTLGFKENDIIYSVDGNELRSYRDYMGYYMSYNGKDDMKFGVFRK